MPEKHLPTGELPERAEALYPVPPRIFPSALFLFVLTYSASAGAQFTFTDGLVDWIDDETYANSSIEIDDGPNGAPTTINLVASGRVAVISASGRSILNIQGGRVTQYVDAYQDSTLRISSTGEVQGNVNVFSANSVLVEGGRIVGWLLPGGRGST